MKKFITAIVLVSVLFLGFIIWDSNKDEQESQSEYSVEESDIVLFYSSTCPHCKAEISFLDGFLKDYPLVKLGMFEVHNSENRALWEEELVRLGAQDRGGVVPFTILGNDQFYVGWSDPVRDAIEKYVQEIYPQLLDEEKERIDLLKESQTTIETDQNIESNELEEGAPAASSEVYGDDNEDSNGSITRFDNTPLFLVALSLGFVDGFNICSLGALLLILSLVFGFKSRKKMFLYGGVFLLVTGVTYAVLVGVWYKIFQWVTPILPYLEFVIGLVALIAGILVLRQFIRFQIYGPVCETSDWPIVTRATQKLRNIIQNPKSGWGIVVGIASFALVVTIMEFPCSAAAPVLFSGILANQGVTSLTYLFYLTIFMIMYLLDELVIFAVSVATLKIWTASNKMSKYILLLQGLIFFIIGGVYVFRIFF